MVDTPKQVGNDEIVENPDKRTISQGNKALRKEQKGEQSESEHDATEDIRMNKGLGRSIQPKSTESDGKK